jgi:restriction system protein
MARLFGVRSYEFTDVFIREGYVAIGAPGTDYAPSYIYDVTPYVKTNDREALQRDYAAAHPELKPRAVEKIVLSYFWRFAVEMRAGDLVLVPAGDTENLRVGVIAGDYYYQDDDPRCPLPHRRKTEWESRRLLRSALSVSVQATLRTPNLFYNILGEVDPAALRESLMDPERATLLGAEKPSKGHALDSIYEAVIERILELDPEEFEILITELLSTLGFEAQHVGRTGDGGIDAVGTLDVYGMARVELKVQCKRYKLDSRINPKQIRDFRGAVPQNSQACFITTARYAKKTWEEATREGFKRIGLINGRQLVDILTEKYHELPAELKDRLNLRLALFPE